MLLNARWFFWILCLLSLVVLTAPMLLRDGVFVDGESYKSLRLAKGGWSSYDGLSYGGRPYIGEQGWHAFLRMVPVSILKYLPLVFGFLSFLFFYLLIERIKPNIKGLASLLFVVSPSYIYLFSSLSKHVGAFLFVLIGFYLFLTNRRWFAYASFFVAGLFSVFSLFLILLVFLVYRFKDKNYKDMLVILLSLVLVFIFYFREIFTLGLPEVIFGFDNFNIFSLLSFMVFGLGGYYGLSFFFFVLSFLGIYSYYKRSYNKFFAYLVLALALLSVFYVNSLLFYLSLVLAFFAACGFEAILSYEWKSEVFRFLTILVICCGLLFSFFVFINDIGDIYPTKAHIEAVSFLGFQEQYGVVFSDYRNGDIISYSGKPNFVDNSFAYAPDLLERKHDMNILLEAKDINVAEDLMDKYGIQYLFIDKRMRSQFFGDRDEGLLFLLKYSPLRFSLVFSNDEVVIWHRIKKPIEL